MDRSNFRSGEQVRFVKDYMYNGETGSRDLGRGRKGDTAYVLVEHYDATICGMDKIALGLRSKQGGGFWTDVECVEPIGLAITDDEMTELLKSLGATHEQE